jgi:hypothetical protein
MESLAPGPVPWVIVVLAVFAGAPSDAAASTCAEYPNQAAAQRAASTRDGDGDGIYCESLPCPCSSTPSLGATGGGEEAGKARSACIKPSAVQDISFSKTKYPDIARHFLDALRKGWPRTLVLDRPGASARRDRLLTGIPTRPGYDRDEYPPAFARGRGPGLMRGSSPAGWLADVEYVPSTENRSHGATMGTKLRRFCDGTKFRYVFY